MRQFTPRMIKICGAIFLVTFIGESVVADRVVMTNNGPLQGITVSADELEIEAFLGIPYAEPPTGRLRFRKPVPKTPWKGVFDASSQSPPCVQNVTDRRYWEPVIENMTEDCLYLNMWVPYSRKGSKLKPIILFFHGGAFNLGTGSMPLYDGTKLARFGDVIVANLNYRVGVMGFFSAFIEDADGNMGIYDQIMAIEWIKDNAKSFGGDPDHLVLMGESAGAMITSGHLSSPLTKNLFKRMILESGAAIVPMILDDNARLYNTSQRLAYLVGCADKKFTLKDNPRLVVQCMKRIPAKELSAAEGRMMETNPVTFFPRTGDAYLPRPHIEALREGRFMDVEMLIGVNKDEGPFFLTAAAPDYFGKYGVDRVNTISRRFAFQTVRLMFSVTEQTNEKEIAEFYINSVQNGTADTYAKAIALALGDYLITCSTYFQAEFSSLRNPVYFYMFSRRPSTTPVAEWVGTTHFDELQYVFGNPLFGNFTPKEIEFSHRLMERWVSFAKTGNPNIPGAISWPVFTHDNPEYIVLDEEESVRLRPDNYRCEFWRDRFRAGINDGVISKVKRSANNGIFVTANVLFILVSVLSTSIYMCALWL